MSVEEVRLEVEHEGFTLATVNEELPREHVLVFRKQEKARNPLQIRGDPPQNHRSQITNHK